MHVLLVTREFPPDIVGGVSYHAHNLAEALKKAGNRVTVLCSRTGDRYDNSTEGIPGVKVKRLKCRRRVSPRVWFDRAVKSYLATEPNWLDSIDVVHSHEYIRFNQTPINQPIIQKVHFNLSRKFRFFPFERYSPIVQPIIKIALRQGIRPIESRLERQAFRDADGVIFVSELANRIQGQEMSIHSPTTVVHNGVDTDRFSPCADTQDSYFLFVGGRQHRKGYKTVREAFVRTDNQLRIIGSERPSDTESHSNIQFIKNIEQSRMADLYRNARALVHPAVYEPFGNVILESLACGTPVITSQPDSCGASEILTDDVAIKIKSESPSELQAVTNNFTKKCFDSKACRKLAEQYKWDRVAEQTMEFAHSLVD